MVRTNSSSSSSLSSTVRTLKIRGRPGFQNVIVSQLPPNVEVLTSWLSAKRGARFGFLCHRAAPSGTFWRQSVRTPESHLPCNKLRRAGDLTCAKPGAPATAGVPRPPRSSQRIECIDISGHQGTDLTASIVVFEDCDAKSEYRKYAIADHQDDLAAMREAVTRRFS